ncbi:MAG: hypothetical protein ACRYGA_12855 [Janthinobacterium lividum]
MSDIKSKKNHDSTLASRNSQPAIATVAIVVSVLLAFIALLGYRVWAQAPDEEDRQRFVQQHPLLPPGVSIRPTLKPVIGDLGGLRVTFPPEFVNNVEYDGDPGFGEKRIGSKPQRTHQSGLRSLGFEVRYPDISAVSPRELRADKSKYTIYNTPWLDVTITASSDFGDGQFLEYMTRNMNNDKDFKFERIAERFHGLDIYTPTTADATKRNRDAQGVYRSDMRDVDIFIHYNKEKKVDAFIRCSNRNHYAAQCDHHFFLGQGVRTHVTVDYRRGMLENWEEIQSKVSKLIFSFRSS